MNITEYDFGNQKVLKEYFTIYSNYYNEYGENTLVLLQKGNFYEIYTLTSEEEDEENIVSKLSKILDLRIMGDVVILKNIKTDLNYKVLGIGFPDVKFDKYLIQIKDLGLIVVLFDQSPENPTIRKVSGIISSGTYIDPNIHSNDILELSNITMCIWIETSVKKIYIGISCIDIYTGNSYIYEYSNEISNDLSNYDELERQIASKNPREYIILSSLEEKEIDKIIKYTNIKSLNIQKINTKTSIKSKNCEKQNYQDEIIKKYYDNEELKYYMFNFNDKIIATQSFCFLLDYIFNHNQFLVKTLNFPIFENSNSRVILSNSALKQLNILETNGNEENVGIYSSVSKMMNFCFTPMGKRHFQYSIINPTIDCVFLNKEYNIIEYLNGLELNVEKNLKKIGDLEKYVRFIYINKITIKDIINLKNMIDPILNIIDIVNIDSTLKKYFESLDLIIEIQDIHSLYEYLNKNINEKDLTINSSFNEELNYITSEYTNNYNGLEKIKNTLNNVLNIKEKKSKKTFIEFIKLVDNKLECTIERCKLLDQDGSYVFSKHTKTHNYITNETIDNITSNLKEYKELIDKIQKKCFSEILEYLNLFGKKITKISNFIKIFDFIFCKSCISLKYNYCKPNIQISDKSFINFKGLRHPLIECLNENEFFVGNDLELSSSSNVICTGSNSSGKSTLLKSIGISIILAQSGFFVSSSEFTYYPYSKIFVRILKNDNIFKSLGSFAVELYDIKTIVSNINIINDKSLILADEILATTETISQQIIIIGLIIYLINNKSTFLFTLHLFEIYKFSEIKDFVDKQILKLFHFSFFYDKLGNLIFNRKLLEGHGPSCYGYEISKMLKLDKNFMNICDNINIKYFKTDIAILDSKQSKYNSNKLLNVICELCKVSVSTEIHHIYQQKNADKNGFISSGGIIIHKNHKNNLLSVCESCHKKEHQ